MTKTNPLVSVILPVYNGEKYLVEALRCVLKQDYRPIEIIVVDDGSTDATARIVEAFHDKVRYFYQQNSGPAAARNFGIRNSVGEFITFIDADDLWPDHKLLLQMNCFQAFPEVGIVQGIVRRIILPDYINDRPRSGDEDVQFINSNLGAMVFRRSVFDKIGYFDENLTYHEDTDLWFRARESGIKVLVQRRTALIYRIHGNNMTTGKDINTLGFTNIIKRSLDRRRKYPGTDRQIPKLNFIPDFLETFQESNHFAMVDSNSWPLVSVVMHVGFNQENICSAIASIQKQEYRPLELVVVGPELSRLGNFLNDQFERLVLIEDKSDNLALQLNKSVEKCSGELITFLGSDAEWAPGKLRTQVKDLFERSMEGYSVGRTRVIINPDIKYAPDLIDGVAFKSHLDDLLDTLMVSRFTFEKVGGFKQGISGMEETDWQLRASDAGFTIKMFREVFLYRFVQTDTPVLNMDQIKSALIESVRASILRKRTARK